MCFIEICINVKKYWALPRKQNPRSASVRGAKGCFTVKTVVRYYSILLYIIAYYCDVRGGKFVFEFKTI